TGWTDERDLPRFEAGFGEQDPDFLLNQTTDRGRRLGDNDLRRPGERGQFEWLAFGLGCGIGGKKDPARVAGVYVQCEAKRAVDRGFDRFTAQALRLVEESPYRSMFIAEIGQRVPPTRAEILRFVDDHRVEGGSAGEKIHCRLGEQVGRNFIPP